MRVLRRTRRAIRLDPSNVNLFCERAYAEYLSGDYRLAIRDDHAVVHFWPEDADYWSDLAAAYEENKNYERALEALAHAIKINLDSSYAYHRRAEVYGSLKKYDLAIADLNQAIALDPNNPDLYESRTLIRVQLNNDVAGALADYDKALKLDPNVVRRTWSVPGLARCRRTMPPPLLTTIAQSRCNRTTHHSTCNAAKCTTVRMTTSKRWLIRRRRWS